MKSSLLDTYHIRDARELRSVLRSSGLVDTTITSPPYWNLKNYGTRNQVGYGQRYDEYLDDLQKIFASVYDVTKSTGSLWIVADTIKDKGELRLFPFDLADRLKKTGWILHDIIVWHKDKTLPWSHRGKLRNIFEYVLFFSKGKSFKYFLSEVRETEGLKEWWVRYPERYSPEGKAPTRTWRINIPRQGSWGENWVRHFCPFPPDLVRRIVLLTTRKGDVVLDPFSGSGVVLAQAKALRRRFVGFDLRRSYRVMFEKKVLPSILELERETQRGRHGEHQKRRLFSSVIWKLRKTKYPRELLRLYKKKHPAARIAGVIAIGREARSLDLTFLFAKDSIPPRGFVSDMAQLMGRPPLSKYGLKAAIRAASLDEHARLSKNGFHSHATVSVYRDGKTHIVSAQMRPDEYLKSLTGRQVRRAKGVPPIASNICVSANREMIR